MFYFIKVKNGSTHGFYTGSGVSKYKADANQYGSITEATTARRNLEIAGRTYIPLTIGHAL